MRAIFSTFDHFMATFVAVIALAWSSFFLPLLGGPLHPYEARAIGAGWQSLSSGEGLNEALEVATSFPAEAIFPSAHAGELPTQHTVALEPAPLELLGGPDAILPAAPRVVRAIRAPTIAAVARMPSPETDPLEELACELPCAIAVVASAETSPVT